MKLLNVVLPIILALSFSTAYAVETAVEKEAATKSEVKNETKKVINRVDEATCLDTDAECLKQKVTNRTGEVTDSVKQKSTEIKNKID